MGEPWSVKITEIRKCSMPVMSLETVVSSSLLSEGMTPVSSTDVPLDSAETSSVDLDLFGFLPNTGGAANPIFVPPKRAILAAMAALLSRSFASSSSSTSAVASGFSFSSAPSVAVVSRPSEAVLSFSLSSVPVSLGDSSSSLEDGESPGGGALTGLTL